MKKHQLESRQLNILWDRIGYFSWLKVGDPAASMIIKDLFEVLRKESLRQQLNPMQSLIS